MTGATSSASALLIPPPFRSDGELEQDLASAIRVKRGIGAQAQNDSAVVDAAGSDIFVGQVATEQRQFPRAALPGHAEAGIQQHIALLEPGRRVLGGGEIF